VAEILIKIVVPGNRREGLKTDPAADFGVGWSNTADDKRVFFGVESLRLFRHATHLAFRFAVDERE
jgi:hypothetical protein